jgi:DNA-binding protein Fis
MKPKPRLKVVPKIFECCSAGVQTHPQAPLHARPIGEIGVRQVWKSTLQHSDRSLEVMRKIRREVTRKMVMATDPKITLLDLPMAVRQAATAELRGGVSPTEAFGEKTSPLDLHETEKRLIAQALAATNGNVTAAAKKLGISRRTVHRQINEMNLAKVPAETTGARGSKE